MHQPLIPVHVHETLGFMMLMRELRQIANHVIIHVQHVMVVLHQIVTVE